MNRAFSKIWIIIIVAVLLAGGILAWQYFGYPREEVKAPEEKVSEEGIIKDETADWKTYRNEKYGFEIRYPVNDWTMNKYSDDNCSPVNDNDQKNCIYFEHNIKKTDFGRIIINISNFSAKENLNQFLQFQQDIPELFRQEDATEILLDGHKGYKVYSGGWGEVPVEGNTIYLEQDKMSSFEISYSWDTSCYLSVTVEKEDPKFIECDKSIEEEIAMIEKILSTFRFLE